MKKLNVSMVVKAKDGREAEAIAQREVTGLTKLVVMVGGGNIGFGCGDNKPLAYGKYQVDTSIEVDINKDVNDIIKAVQREWATKDEILNSTIFVTEGSVQQQEAPKPQHNPATVSCANCGQMLMKGSEYTVNPETANEYHLCGDCIDNAIDGGDIVNCGICDAYFDADELVKNPVTGSDDLCPYCGNKID